MEFSKNDGGWNVNGSKHTVAKLIGYGLDVIWPLRVIG
jgi:hypothetical protein